MKAMKAAIAGAVVLAFAGGGLFLGAGAASAATPGFEPDANSEGSIVFYDSTGHVITGGNNLAHLFDYAVASSDATRTGTNQASTTFGFPDHTKPDSSTWFQAVSSSATAFPNTTAPAPINGFGTHRPVAQAGATEANLSALLSTTTLDTTAGYANIVQVRLKDSGAGIGNGILAKPFWETDIMFNQAAGTWTQVFPAAPTTTTLGASPNPAASGGTVTLTATLSPSSAVGSVQFRNGSTNIGAPVPVSGGVATTTTTTLPVGTDSLAADFVPTDSTAFTASTGTFSETITPPATPTTTGLAVSGGYLTAAGGATLTATVTGPGSTPNGAGTVAFYDNGSSTAIPGTVTAGPTGTFTLTLSAPDFAAGGHSIVAKFTPTDPTTFAASQSNPTAFLTQPAAVGACAQPGSVCTETQNITATVPVGTLVINTPYTSTSPLNLGTLALTPDSTQFTGSATFQNIVVTDTRSGGLPWTVQALAGNLTDGGTNANSVINAQNVGLTAEAVTSSGAGFNTAGLTFTDNAAAAGVAPTDPGSLGLGGSAPHTIAHATLGVGTVNFHGTLTLNAPSSTEAGIFGGTITFTVG